MERLNILCLHGYRGSGESLRRQLAPLADGLDDLVKFAYLNAPSRAAGGFGWWHAKATEAMAAQMETRIGQGAKRYQGWPATLDAVLSVFMRQGPFDGVLGFSQGAALTALLVGLRSRGRAAGNAPALPAKETSSQPEALAFGFAVMIGGFVSADRELARLYDERSNYELPSAHIIGRSDTVVPREASLALASKFENPLILEHEGGHVIPKAPQMRERFQTFLEDMQQRKGARALR
ncbi:MAG: hypothetical protein ACHQAQ_00085 [Hyphomicrobiales bacterium]